MNKNQCLFHQDKDDVSAINTAYPYTIPKESSSVAMASDGSRGMPVDPQVFAALSARYLQEGEGFLAQLFAELVPPGPSAICLPLAVVGASWCFALPLCTDY